MELHEVETGLTPSRRAVRRLMRQEKYMHAKAKTLISMCARFEQLCVYAHDHVGNVKVFDLVRVSTETLTEITKWVSARSTPGGGAP
jgi:hypothetical protein